MSNLDQISPLDLLSILSAYHILGIGLGQLLPLTHDYIKRHVTRLPPRDLARCLMSLAKVRMSHDNGACLCLSRVVPRQYSLCASDARACW